MFPQAKVINHEYLQEGARQAVVGRVRLAGHPDCLPEVPSMSADVSPGDVYRRRDNLVTREIVGETIIVPISGELADLQNVYSLNPTGAFVWQCLNGSDSLEQIQAAMTREFDVDAKSAWGDLAELIAELHRAALVERVE